MNFAWNFAWNFACAPSRTVANARITSLIRRAVFAFVMLGAGLLAAAGPSGRAAAQSPAPSGELEAVTLVTASGEHVFQVEVMRTDEQRARGLMFRKHLPADRGMLFDFKTEQRVMMWMRNTYISLDMVFIARDGTVVNVAQDTEPLSERTIPSAGPALAVLEVNAGVARRIGLKAGDKVRHPLFGR
jgi:uncharacterized membrane protein (UPF0127 family)